MVRSIVSSVKYKYAVRKEMLGTDWGLFKRPGYDMAGVPPVYSLSRSRPNLVRLFSHHSSGHWLQDGS